MSEDNKEEKDFADKAKDTAKEIEQEVKETAEEAKEILSDNKTIAIIAHITIIGWIIAIIQNNQNKTEYASFYIRQTLGIMLVGFLSFIPLIGIVLGILALVFWIISLINAIGGNTKPVFLLGDKFQEWFKSL